MVIAKITRKYFTCIMPKKAKPLIFRTNPHISNWTITMDAYKKQIISLCSLPLCVFMELFSLIYWQAFSWCLLVTLVSLLINKTEGIFNIKLRFGFCCDWGIYNASFTAAQCSVQNWSVQSLQKEPIFFGCWIAIIWLIQCFAHSISV